MQKLILGQLENVERRQPAKIAAMQELSNCILHSLMQSGFSSKVLASRHPIEHPIYATLQHLTKWHEHTLAKNTHYLRTKVEPHLSVENCSCLSCLVLPGQMSRGCT